jgi:two-component system, OmpR family, sensor histidine kinase KdpD
MARGQLRIYLGAAPGVGKTFAMLDEGWRRRSRGTDVVVALVETHGRPKTLEQIRDLEVVPRRRLDYRGTSFEEMDLDAVLARRPQVALVDELAHTNVPGCRNDKRWQDVEEMLAAGIDVISTVNIQHLESVNDVVEEITGIQQLETVPDEVVRAADQIELVDMAPEALRRRMAHGNIYGPDKVDAALANYFRAGNLSALRELALLWTADRVDEALRDYREAHGIHRPWETRERIVVAVTGAPSTEMLIRRAARMATRSHAELVGVHVRSDAGLADATTSLEEHRRLLADLGGTYHEVVGSDPAESLVRFALAENATQLVLGATSRPRWREVLSGGSVINRVIRSAGPIDVHVISGDEAPDGDGERLLPPRRRRPTTLPPGRQAAGWVMCAVGIPLLTLLLLAVEQHLNLPSEMLLYLLLVGAVAVVGGLWPALFAAVTTSLIVNWFFTPPVHTWTIAEADNVVALAVFLLVAGMVSLLVSRLSRRSADAIRARSEAEAIAAVAGNLVDAENALEVAVGHLRSTFGLDAVAVLQPDGDGYLIEASSGEPVPSRPEGHVSVDLRGGALLVLDGPSLHSDDLQVLHAFVAQLGAALEQRDLRAEAQVAAAAAEGDRLRTAILRAVSHDLRTPLASIKASVTSLMQHDVDWSEHDRDEFLATIEEEADRLNRMVGNLLDMSRLQSGTVEPGLRPVGLEEVVPRALVSISGEAAELGREQVVVEVGEQLPRVVADPDLLERVIANLVANALLHSGPGTPVRIEGGRVGTRVDLRVVDRGIGVPLRDREAMFEPFQRMGDGVADSGVGLGLAVSRGFVDAMGGELTVDDTPGGGLTFTVSLPVAS